MAVRISDRGILAVEKAARQKNQRLRSTSSTAVRKVREWRVTMASEEGRRVSGKRED